MISPRLQTTAYILSPDRRSVLLMRRDKYPQDIHFGKYMGLGGHVEAGEDPVTCIRREIAEESGLTAGDLTLRGTVMWTNFANTDALCFMFRVDTFTGTHHGGNEEGTLEWVPLAEVRDKPMWDSDHEWLPMIFDDDQRQFHGVMPYDGYDMLSWSYQRI
ncbi:7,8-dihydro-8-oxoguanine triphosphatase [Longispora fulva]|uniref:8-oxo-dGTP diphosphatase n=1 Tax=Longispora fulva TaxID=619741 RepID=A0A8J7GD08_9ACTN|nr:8-oxo-dGTP diphosphatase [Longispora fulva]MBG6138303.1 8-oxo-dGTP diphosphatase [Longispora fulva]GIG60554.1 7,8-dihydro-8-oxoguanine triphosphatase [Longispora fulva]